MVPQMLWMLLQMQPRLRVLPEVMLWVLLVSFHRGGARSRGSHHLKPVFAADHPCRPNVTQHRSTSLDTLGQRIVMKTTWTT